MKYIFCVIMMNKADLWVGEMAPYCCCRGPEFDSQNSRWAAHNCLRLQFHGAQTPLVSHGVCIDTHIPTHRDADTHTLKWRNWFKNHLIWRMCTMDGVSVPWSPCSNQRTTLWRWFSSSTFVQGQRTKLRLAGQVSTPAKPAHWPQIIFSFRNCFLPLIPVSVYVICACVQVYEPVWQCGGQGRVWVFSTLSLSDLVSCGVCWEGGPSMILFSISPLAASNLQRTLGVQTHITF